MIPLVNKAKNASRPAADRSERATRWTKPGSWLFPTIACFRAIPGIDDANLDARCWSSGVSHHPLPRQGWSQSLSPATLNPRARGDPSHLINYSASLRPGWGEQAPAEGRFMDCCSPWIGPSASLQRISWAGEGCDREQSLGVGPL
jgi:hypothetical protein